MNEIPEVDLRMLGEATAEALAPTERRVEVERMQVENDQLIARLAQLYKAQIPKADIVAVRLDELCTLLLGDMDSPKRLDYEHAVQMRFTTLLADLEGEILKGRLLTGVRLDRPDQGPNGRRRG